MAESGSQLWFPPATQKWDLRRQQPKRKGQTKSPAAKRKPPLRRCSDRNAEAEVDTARDTDIQLTTPRC